MRRSSTSKLSRYPTTKAFLAKGDSAGKAIAARPADPVSQDEDLRNLEVEVIRPLTRKYKQSDPEGGSTISNVASVRLRDIEYEIVRGKKIKTSAKLGHEKVHGTPEQKHARWQGMRDAVASAFAEHPKWTWAKIQAKVANKFRVSTKTIRRHVPNPKKNS